MSNDLFRELDQVFSDILAGTSQAGRIRTARAVGQVLRKSQQQRIKAQQNPEGSPYPARRRRVLRSQQGIVFVWQGEIRRLKNWHGGRGNTGAPLPALTKSATIFARFTAAILSVTSRSIRAQCAAAQQRKCRCFSDCAAIAFSKCALMQAVQPWAMTAWPRALRVCTSTASAIRSGRVPLLNILCVSCWALPLAMSR